MERPIFPFLWMRGENEATLRREIEKIAECGIKAVCVEARPARDQMNCPQPPFDFYHEALEPTGMFGKTEIHYH